MAEDQKQKKKAELKTRRFRGGTNNVKYLTNVACFERLDVSLHTSSTPTHTTPPKKKKKSEVSDTVLKRFFLVLSIIMAFPQSCQVN